MATIFETATHVFDPLHSFWESKRTTGAVTTLLIAVFLLSLAGSLLKRNGFLVEQLAWFPYTNPFQAISLAFTLVLIVEVISLIFVLPCSISKAVGKQLEILALILIRGAFKELTHFDAPIHLADHMGSLVNILVQGSGALAIFALLGIFHLLLSRQSEDSMSGESLFHYVAAKKIVALIILATFIAMGGDNIWRQATGGKHFEFFSEFYTVLIFSDILLVLISQRFLPSFRAIFRNSGFALSTLLMRLALTAPGHYKALTGVTSALFAVLLTLIFNQLFSSKKKGHGDRS